MTELLRPPEQTAKGADAGAAHCCGPAAMTRAPSAAAGPAGQTRTASTPRARHGSAALVALSAGCSWETLFNTDPSGRSRSRERSDGPHVWSLRQKVESPGLSKRRCCAFDWPKRRFASLGRSSFWRNDHTVWRATTAVGGRPSTPPRGKREQCWEERGWNNRLARRATATQDVVRDLCDCGPREHHRLPTRNTEGFFAFRLAVRRSTTGPLGRPWQCLADCFRCQRGEGCRESGHPSRTRTQNWSASTARSSSTEIEDQRGYLRRYRPPAAKEAHVSQPHWLMQHATCSCSFRPMQHSAPFFQAHFWHF